MSITVKVDVSAALLKVSTMRRQLPYATARALTETARAARLELGKEIERSFQAPTPWIKSGTFSTSASKETLSAQVGIKDVGARASQAKYLKEHIGGGVRSSKPMELAMRALGILPAGWLVVPSNDGVRKDAYGNVPKATITRVIAAVQSRATAKRGADSFRVIVVRPGQANARTRHLAPGIWSINAVGAQVVVKPVFLFVHAASYRTRLDLAKIVGAAVEREFDQRFATAIAAAVESSR